MPGTTTRLALPYALPDDTTDPPRDIKALAEKLDQVVYKPEPGDLKFSARTGEHGAWIKADGRALASGEYTPLRDALIADGSPFGASSGNPRLPDMQGRVPVGAGAGAGLTARTPGQAGGVESVVLSTAQMPSHSHSAPGGTYYKLVGTLNQPYDVPIVPGNGNWNTGTIGAPGSTGGGQAHENMPPHLVGTWFVYAG